MMSSEGQENYNPRARVVFLAGLSGTGKTALVQEFIKQQQREKIQLDIHLDDLGDMQIKPHNQPKPTQLIFLQGKYNQLSSGDPFLAISQALNSYVTDLTHRLKKSEILPFIEALMKVDIYLVKVLCDTILP